MFGNFAVHSTIMLAATIQKDPGVIIGPISKFLGAILNFIFNISYGITINHSLGISIILLTIVARVLMLPLAFKQQKSMEAMQKLQPEMEKIKKKYPDSKDPEVQQKMNVEIQALYAKNKVNPLSGCLPLFIQMPIFFALSYIMNQSYLFVKKLGDVYADLAQAIISVPDYVKIIDPVVYPMLPKGMEFDYSRVSDIQKALNKFTTADWNGLFAKLPADVLDKVTGFYAHKQSIEHFAGINLIDASGLGFPGILIPILAGATTFLSSYLMNKMQKPADNNAQMQQRMMLIIMPIMMGAMTIGLPSGVGLYWITSSIFQIGQQFIMNRRFFAKNEVRAEGKE